MSETPQERYRRAVDEVNHMRDDGTIAPKETPPMTKTSTPAAQGTVAAAMTSTVEPDFLKTLMGAASMAESEAKDETDEGKVWSLNFLAGKLRDAAFVIDQMTKLRDGQIALGYKLVPVEPTDEMLAATCDESGRMRLLEFTTPEERSKAFLVPRYAYRAMLSASPPPPTEALPASGVDFRAWWGSLPAPDRYEHQDWFAQKAFEAGLRAALSPTEAPAPAPGGVVRVKPLAFIPNGEDGSLLATGAACWARIFPHCGRWCWNLGDVSAGSEDTKDDAIKMLTVTYEARLRAALASPAPAKAAPASETEGNDG